MQRLPIYLALAFGASLLVTPAGAQVSVRPGDAFQPLVTSNPTLRASLLRIAERSVLWREAMAVLQQAKRKAVVLTPDQVVVADEPGGLVKDGFDRAVLAEVAPVAGVHSGVDVVLVVINLTLLEESHRHARSLPWEFEADLERILIHEIYGHAVPYLLAGHLSGRCPDPAPGERAEDACSIRRENAVRAELGLGRRTSYSLDDLNLARRTKRWSRLSYGTRPTAQRLSLPDLLTVM
jgi:hypothetical protein